MKILIINYFSPYLIIQVWSIKRSLKQNAIPFEEKDLLNIFNNFCCCRSCKTQDGNAWKLPLQNSKEFKVRPEVMSPLTCTMNFINDNSYQPPTYQRHKRMDFIISIVILHSVVHTITKWSKLCIRCFRAFIQEITIKYCIRKKPIKIPSSRCTFQLEKKNKVQLQETLAER